jgi:hypothetical protein
MEGSFSTGQSPQWAVVEEEEENDDDDDDDDDDDCRGFNNLSYTINLR